VAGGAGLGMWALCGGLAVGWLAAGGCALGWLAAKGGVALAQGYAISGEAFAPQANNEAARSFYEQNFFLAHDAAFLIGAGVFALAALAAVCLMLFRLSGRSRSGS